MPEYESSFTRPANTTQYAANDAVNDLTSSPTQQSITVWTKHAGVVMSEGTATEQQTGWGVIVSAILTQSVVASVIAADFQVVLFDTAPTAMEDNAAFDPSDAEAANIIGVIDFGSSPHVFALNSVYVMAQEPIRFWCGTTGLKTLYYVVRVNNAYTPTSGETLTLRLGVLEG